MPHDYKAPRQSNVSPIAKARMEKGWTQSQLASAIGANPRFVSMWENGALSPSIRYLDKIAKVLDVDLKQLIENSPEKKYRNNIAKYRKAKNMSQNELADAVGIRQGTLSTYETGAWLIPDETLQKISEVLGVPAEKLGNPREFKSITPIAEYRKKANLSQTELAEKSGISLSTISNYEVGRTTPSRAKLQKIADALDVPVEKLMVEEGK